MTRAFVALALPAGQRGVLGDYLERCAARAPGFRWVPPDSVHLTLRFLGTVTEPVLAGVTERLAAIRQQPFRARVGGLGSFGGRRPTVAWIGLPEGREAAAALATACEEACQAAGLEPEARPFRPHVTLARSRDRRGEPLPDLPPPPNLPAWTVTEFALFESRLRGGSPPEYVPLESFRLRE